MVQAHLRRDGPIDVLIGDDDAAVANPCANLDVEVGDASRVVSREASLMRSCTSTTGTTASCARGGFEVAVCVLLRRRRRCACSFSVFPGRVDLARAGSPCPEAVASPSFGRHLYMK